MEDSKKKMNLVVVVVGCIVLAGVIFYYTNMRPATGVSAELASQNIWIKCKDCGGEYEMKKRAYLDFIAKNAVGMVAPPLKCEKCGKDAAFRAVKCEKCGKVFFYGTEGEYPDKCPDCGVSKLEETRKAATEAK